MNVDLYNFVSALNCIVAQRLVRKICDACKRPIKVLVATLLDESGLDPEVYGDYHFLRRSGLHRV